MEPLTIILILVAVFLVFLMLTSGHRKHRLETALNELETERMKLMKSIEHVKISFYQKKLGETEAQDKIFEYEERLRKVETKIDQIKEKPLMKTLDKQKETEIEEKAEIIEERVEIKRAERFALSNMDSKTVMTLFILAIFAIIFLMLISGKPTAAGESFTDKKSIPLSALTVPEGGVPPGSNAGLRVEIENDLDIVLEDVSVVVRAPEGSGIRFKDGSVDMQMLPAIGPGGSRELFFGMSVGENTPEGEYMIEVEILNDQGIGAITRSKLIVRIGKTEYDV